MMIIGIVEYKKVLNILKNIGKVIIKPTVDSCSGNNVKLLNIKNGIDTISNENIENILKKYNKNFVIQEKIVQHKDFAKLNPSSVNTIRINTYICEGKVYCTPMVMRMGRNGSIVDNNHQGGVVVGINKDGELRKIAISQPKALEKIERFERHPDTNIKFEGYKIPKIKEMMEFVKKYHYKIPHIGYIGWDLTLDEDENIVIIETNITCPGPGFIQYINGESLFGENTEKMIRLLKEKEGKK